MKWFLDILRTIADPRHLRRTLLITLLVGIWLSLFNEGPLLFVAPWSIQLGTKVFLNFLTPFVVANLGLVAHR